MFPVVRLRWRWQIGYLAVTLQPVSAVIQMHLKILAASARAGAGPKALIHLVVG
jgi:hypothetical protein